MDMKMDRQVHGRLERWLTKVGKERPLAVILGGSVNGLSFARSLSKQRIPSLLLDSERLIGTYTRCSRFALLRDADEHPQDWIDLLEFLGSRLDTPGVLLPTTDVHCMLISQEADSLRSYFRFLVPDTHTMEQIVNKRLQYGIANAAGIPIPVTYFPESVEEVRGLSTGLPYPCILKPYKSHLARQKIAKKVVVVHTPAELISEYCRINSDDAAFMVQEIIPGEDEALFGYLAFWDALGRESSWLTKQKLRQYPPYYGDGSLQITVEAPEVAELSRRLLQKFNFRGLVGVEFKFDSRDRSYRLMEINPRTVSGNQLAISAGVDFPQIVYQYLTGCNLGMVPTEPFRRGIKYVNEEWDVKAYLALRKSSTLTLRPWLYSLRGTRARAIGAWNDPLPLVVMLWRFLRAFCRDLRWVSRRTVKS